MLVDNAAIIHTTGQLNVMINQLERAKCKYTERISNLCVNLFQPS